MREIIPGAASGSSAVCPNKVCPFWTVSRLVPSLSIWASRPACDEEERPRTATIAATPMAIPSADSAARIRRVRRPTLAIAGEIGETQPGRFDVRARAHPRGRFRSEKAVRAELPVTVAVTA